MNDKDMLLLAKYRARQETLYAVKQGMIKKLPCRQCGLAKSEAHHVDYSRPLDVVWLCKTHHTMLHHWVISNRLSRGNLTELQEAILNYIELDSTNLNLKRIAKDCNAWDIPSAALAIAALLTKGYLKPVLREPADEDDVEAYLDYVHN